MNPDADIRMYGQMHAYKCTCNPGNKAAFTAYPHRHRGCGIDAQLGLYQLRQDSHAAVSGVEPSSRRPGSHEWSKCLWRS